MAVMEIQKISAAQFATSCIICEKTIPVLEPAGRVMVCDECKNAVFEVKFLLSQLRPCNPVLMERLEIHRAAMGMAVCGGADNGL